MARVRAYDPRIFKIDTKRAEKSLKKYLKPSKDHPRAVYVVGKCPRCTHDIDFTKWLTIAAPDLDSLQGIDADARLEDAFDQKFASGDLEFSMGCDCKVAHPKSPEGKEGCGSRFKVHVKW